MEAASKSLSPNSNGVHEVSLFVISIFYSFNNTFFTQNTISVLQVSESFPGKEEMESSLQKMETKLKETSQERDKALQQLNRLKQHLLEKVLYPSLLFHFLDLFYSICY